MNVDLVFLQMLGETVVLTFYFVLTADGCAKCRVGLLYDGEVVAAHLCPYPGFPSYVDQLIDHFPIFLPSLQVEFLISKIAGDLLRFF